MSIKTAEPNKLQSVGIELEIAIDRPISKVWKALVTETTKWWPKDFYTSKNTKAFVIEPKLGGRMYEKLTGGAGLVWMTVYGIEPPKYL
ncbi:MAG: hypothetical protein ACREBV_08550 [Candidatus Zixiibacteriota bacterium]